MDQVTNTDNDPPERREFSSAIMSATLPFALVLGLKLEELTAEFGFSARDLFAVEARLPDDLMPRLWLMMAERRPGEALPVNLAKAAPTSAMSDFAKAVQFAETLGSALRVITEHQIVLADRADFMVSVDNGLAAWTVSHPADEIDGGMTNHAGLGLFWRLFKEVMEIDMELIRVDIQHDCVGGSQPYEEFFRAPVREAAGRNALVFDASALTLPVQHSCPTLFAYAEEHLRQFSKRLLVRARGTDFARLQQAIVKNAAIGRFDPSSAALSVGLSVRSAQRIAAAEGSSVLQMIDTVRADMAKSLLLKPGATNETVGAMLGYSDGRAFRRAFKRWTGQSPAEFKQSASSKA